MAVDSPWDSRLVVGCTAALLLGYGVFWAWHRPRVLLGALVAGSALLSWGIPVGVPLTTDGLTVDLFLTGWLTLTCIVVGALMRPARVAVLVGGIVVFGALALLAWRSVVEGYPVHWLGLATDAAGAVLDCLVVASAAMVLRRTARRSDLSSARAAAATSQAVRSQAAADELRRVARLLHDSVINTLAAVARWSTRDSAAIRARCEQDLTLLESISGPPPITPQHLLTSLEDRGRLLGLPVSVRVTEFGPPLDPVIADAVMGACGEALNNVAKHAPGSGAVVHWSWDGQLGQLTVTDTGPGFDARGGWSGGAAQSVAARSAEAGVTATVTSTAAGTTVCLSWTGEPVSQPASPPARRALEVDGEVAALMGEMVVRITAAFVVFGLICAATIPPGWPRIGTVLGFAMVAAVGVLGARVHSGALRSTQIPWITYPTVTLLATALPGMGLSGCPRVDLWWGGLAGVAVVVGAVMLDRRGWVVAATVLAYLAGNAAVIHQVGLVGGACVADAWSTMAANLAVIVAVWAFARQLHRVWAMGRREQQRTVDALARSAGYEAQARVRTSMLGFARSVCEPILSRIADGRLEPDDPRVRFRCGQVESILRSLSLAALVEASSIGQLLVDLIRTCVARDVTLILKGNPSTIPEDLTSQAQSRLEVLPGCPEAGSALTLTVLRSGGDEVLLVALVDRPTQTACEDLGGAGWECSSQAGQLLAETTLLAQGTAHERQPVLQNNA